MVEKSKVDELIDLTGQDVTSLFVPGVTYRVGSPVGHGAMAVAFFSLRLSQEGRTPIVLKVLKPSFVRQYGQAATLTIQKEAVALGRLNERVPSTPYVVRLLDTGVLVWQDDYGKVDLPWLAVEYVHGGPMGTTLTQRVRHSVQETGYAFGLERASLALKALNKGLTAVHEVGVVHRDLKPGNVLCCGWGKDELFKVADFGVARPSGLTGTFFRDFVGTPGYVAPEAFGNGETAVGPWTDVFGLAAVFYFMLTGQKYINASNPSEMLVATSQTKRRSILESAMLHPDFRSRDSLVAIIDAALSEATAIDPGERPATISAFVTPLLSWLESARGAAVSSIHSGKSPSSWNLASVPSWSQHRWVWLERQAPVDGLAVRGVSWDGDGKCLASTSRGLLFWNGTNWKPLHLPELGELAWFRFVHRAAARRWIVGYGQSQLATITTGGVLDTVNLGKSVNNIKMLDGDMGDLAVMLDDNPDPNQAEHLRAMTAWRWIREMPVDKAHSLNSIARVGDAEWVVVGRDKEGTGLVGLYRPLDFSIDLFPAPKVRAFIACAGRPGLGIGAAVGAEGAVVWWSNGSFETEIAKGNYDLSAVAIDPQGTGWVAGAGRIWRREVVDDWVSWEPVWHDEEWQVPFVSLFADAGLVFAVTADGAILEGRVVEDERDTELMVR